MVGASAPRAPRATRELLAAAAARGVAVRPLSFVSRSFSEDIAEVAKVKGARLVVLGWHKPVLGQSILGGNVYEIMRRTTADVAVYVGRRPAPWRRVLVPYTGGAHDRAALELAGRIAERGDAHVTVLHVVRPKRSSGDPRQGVAAVIEPMGSERVTLKIVESEAPLEAAVEEARQGYDLVVIGASDDWGLEPTMFSTHHERLAELPASMLIVRRTGAAHPRGEPAGRAQVAVG